ncbi:hypothetical protein [Haloarcula amylolytica]|uniref:Uncharacterized protein n=1 Tax=Haloarcula amylolytica JCM 13557 TaxID=1227452 RepID=M0KQ89_9EURY|nr:hypothetical protein [Haloarcula amylolytica]EMA23098.1 hypothetical protein C442_08731 [Haloarcula amylolytica JCM 13557]
MTGGSQLHEESGSDKITFRLPTHLKEQYQEQVDNMSADLEEYVRRKVSEPTQDGGVEPYADPDDRDLAVAYRTLCKKRTKGGIVRGETAKRALAQAVDNIDQQGAQRLLNRLAKRGYVRLQNGIPPSDYMAVHVRPFSRHDPAQGGAKADV